MIDIGPMVAGAASETPRSRPRLTERHVVALGLGVSGIFVLAAVSVALLGVAGHDPLWAAMHLALAGAALTAIGTFVPHFAITLAGTRPQPARQRLTGIGLIAAGGGLVVAGMEVLGGDWAAAGSAAVLGGLALTAWQTIAPLRDPLARRHPIATIGYLVALAELAAGVALGGLAAAGVPIVIGAWATLRPAHAWLTLFGAVSLTIFATLVYLAPTVVGARIRASRMLAFGTIGMLAGPPLAALGFALAVPIPAAFGAAVTAVGAVAQVAYMIDVVRRRGRFSSEHDWRRVAAWHLVAGTCWFAAAAVAVTVDLATGRSISGWSVGPLAIPLVAGWMLQELVGSWTHLVPGTTPGAPAQQTARRRVLAALSRVRPVAWNIGVAGAWTGLVVGLPSLALLGAALVASVLLLSVVLLLRALTLG